MLKRLVIINLQRVQYTNTDICLRPIFFNIIWILPLKDWCGNGALQAACNEKHFEFAPQHGALRFQHVAYGSNVWPCITQPTFPLCCAFSLSLERTVRPILRAFIEVFVSFFFTLKKFHS